MSYILGMLSSVRFVDLLISLFLLIPVQQNKINPVNRLKERERLERQQREGDLKHILIQYYVVPSHLCVKMLPSCEIFSA